MALHVAPKGGKWGVRESSKRKAKKKHIFDTQAEAVECALALTTRPVYVHGVCGRIVERITD